ncbi:MAG TPA: thioredoxin family protein, partial [Kofleriaceae bacterium]|nr:thioredoxin family protein [Kofleriaceae bacterium]
MRGSFILFASVLAAGAAGCGKAKEQPKARHPGTGTGAGTGTASTVAAKATCPAGEAKGPLTWIEDDYAGALACARAKHRPLLIDMWAPWCHTCLSMKSTVLMDASLAPLNDQLVFLSMDTDKPTNADALAKYPLVNWPTFFVVEPDHETVQGRWLGAASTGQMRTFLKDGETAALAAMSGGGLDPLLAKVREGDQASERKEFAAAEAAYGAALAQAPADWPRRSDVLVAQIGARYKQGDIAGCLDLGLSSADATGDTANAADFLVWALMCADDDKADPAKAKAVREKAVARLTALVDDQAAPLSIDDRSDAMANLREALDSLGKKDEAKKVAERQLAFLADAAAKAPDAWTRMTYNWPRADVHVYLGRGLELVPALEQSAKDLPNEYDPPARLAWVLLKSGKADDAQPWVEKALRLVYGPRKVRVQQLAADIAKARGNVAMERAARTALVSTLEHLEKGQEQPEALAKAKADLAAMDGAAGTAAGSGSASP